MKPFKPNPQQLEAISNGCTKLWIPFSELAYRYLKEEDFMLSIYCCLQPGEQYFVQEEFVIDEEGCFLKVKPHFLDNLVIPKYLMTEQQSRFKFTATGVEVKQVQNLDIDDAFALGISCPAETEIMSWHDKQYPEQPYLSKPYGFLVNIERI